MTWWLNLSASLRALPSLPSFLPSKPSTQYLLSTCTTCEQLQSILSDRAFDILCDNTLLAQARVSLSYQLVEILSECLQKLESHQTYFAIEATDARRLPNIWPIVSNSQLRAEKYTIKVTSIENVKVALYQFIGMHMQAIQDIQQALQYNRSEHLARAIVASSRQASSFLAAVSTSSTHTQLVTQVRDAVRSSLGAVAMRDATNAEVVAEQLGQMWNQNSRVNNPSKQQTIASHDVQLTLQILQREITMLRTVRARLKRIIRSYLSPPWDVERRPVRYCGLAVATSGLSRQLLVHARFLGGSGAVEQTVMQYATAGRSFLTQSIIEPVIRFYDQIFRLENGSSTNVVETKSSFREMLVDFTERNLKDDETAKDLANNGSMKAVMELLVEQARNPIRNAIKGNLTQAMLLQVQKLKCDVEELMQKTRQLMRAQELNLAMVALVPSLLLVTAVTYVVSTVSWRWRKGDVEMIVSSGQTAKLLLGDLHEALVRAEGCGGEVLKYVECLGKMHAKVCELEFLVARGIVRAPKGILVRFASDLERIRDGECSLNDRQRHVDRMLQCYPFLNH